MPEGPTLHAIARDLNAAFAGTVPQITSPQGRFDGGAALLSGHVFERSWAHGKLLFADFDHGRSLYVHLGLIGSFRITRFAGTTPAVRGAVRLRLLHDHQLAELRGPMACQVLDPVEVTAKVAAQGPDPLDSEAIPERAWAKIRASRRSIAELLMDQSVLAGVGNVYRCEVLFRHRVNPAVAGNRLKPATWHAIWGDLVELMPLGVAAGRLITRDAEVRDAQAAGAEAAQRVTAVNTRRDADARYSVYRRDGLPCERCGSRVRTRLIAGRNLFWCGNCQRRS